MAPRRPRQNESDQIAEQGPPTGEEDLPGLDPTRFPYNTGTGSRRPENVFQVPGQPIGVPGEMVTETGFQPFHPQRIERDAYGRRISGPSWNYFQGDEWEPTTWSGTQRGRGRIKQLQEQLAELGLLEQYRPGYWDDRSAQAYYMVLSFANQRGITADMAVRQYPAEAEMAEDEQARQFPPLVTKLTPTEDLRRVFREATTQLTGQGWSREQVENAIAAYHSRERQMQLAEDEMRYDREAGEPGPGGEVEGTPTPESFIEQRIRERDPLAIPAHEMLSLAQDTLSFLSSPSWGAGLGGGGGL